MFDRRIAGYPRLFSIWFNRRRKPYRVRVYFSNFCFLPSCSFISSSRNIFPIVFRMYPHSTAVSICQSGIVVLVLFSYPLQLHPARASLDKFLFPSPITPSRGPSTTTPPQALSESDASDSGEESTLSPPMEDPVVEEEEIPLARFIIESSVILFSTFVIAMFVSSLETVLGFVGATGSTTISFILPSLFCTFLLLSLSREERKSWLASLSIVHPVLSLFKNSMDPKDRKLRLLAWILLIWGFVVMILSLSMNICEHPYSTLSLSLCLWSVEKWTDSIRTK